jgi:hemerythrin-like domain-containing protein
VLLQEHQTGRELVGKMEASLEKLDLESIEGKASFQDLAENYISLLTQHIDEENQVLFPMAEKKLSRQQQHRMSEQFDRLEKERIGEGRHEAFHQLMEDLAGIYCT